MHPHTFHLDTSQNCSTPTLGVSIKKSHHLLLALLLSNKAPNIPITTSINISKRGLGALKKERRGKEK
jgi:hypothetical protein